MNNGFDYLINSASEFEQTHIKKYLSGKKQRIKKIFKEFCFIFERLQHFTKRNNHRNQYQNSNPSINIWTGQRNQLQ